MNKEFDPEFAGPSDWAQFYRSAGLQVVPAKAPSEGTAWKRPALSSWREFENELASDDVFTLWWGPKGQHSQRTNMGLITGKASGNVFVVDVDSQRHDEARDWLASVRYDAGVSQFDTPTQQTGGGGLQLLFRAPEGWVPPTCKTPIGIDIRGQGGFAVLAPSLHDSGQSYRWLPGFEPWTVGIMEAPRELVYEIDELIKRYGAARVQATGTGPVIKTATPPGQQNEFGQRVDGREDYMTRMIWGRVCELYRECPLLPGEQELQEACRESFKVYERHVKSRLLEPGTPNAILLEREGRGHSLFQQKWLAALRLWDTKVAETVAAGVPSAQGAPPPQVDPLTGEILSAEFQQPIDLYELLNVQAIKNLPEQRFLIEGLVAEQSLGFVYGPPGCGKSFIAMGMAFSLACGLTAWWERQIHVSGPVIYISSEGVGDIKNRIRAWEVATGNQLDDKPFYLIRQTIDFMSPDNLDKLLRTIKSVADEQKINPVAVFIDTVSRTLPGADENLQADASLWVKATDVIRETFGCSAIAVHHTNRAGSNLRGSTVFDGAADWMLEVAREPAQEYGAVRAAKIKAAPDGWTQAFQLKKQAIGDLRGTESLYALPALTPPPSTGGWPDRAVVNSILTALGAAWDAGEPWSPHARSASEGRYAVSHMSRWGVKEETATQMVEQWQMDKIIVLETYDTKRKLKGLKLLRKPQAEIGPSWTD